MSANIDYLSLGELADALGVQSWRIGRLFESGELREPPRVGRQRAIPKAMVPAIVEALRRHGWIADSCLFEGPK